MSEVSEDSGSHLGFFIGDDEILQEITITPLQAYLALTRQTWQRLSDPTILVNLEESTPLLEAWSQKLCHLLCHYTNIKTDTWSEERTLRSLTTVCPWSMDRDETAESQYLAMLCVVRDVTKAIDNYKLATEYSSTSYTMEVTCSSRTLAFCRALWFLMDQEEMVDYIQLIAASDDNRAKDLWKNFINCLIG